MLILRPALDGLDVGHNDRPSLTLFKLFLTMKMSRPARDIDFVWIRLSDVVCRA